MWRWPVELDRETSLSDFFCSCCFVEVDRWVFEWMVDMLGTVKRTLRYIEQRHGCFLTYTLA